MPEATSDQLSIEALLDMLEKSDPNSDFYRGAAGVLDRNLVVSRLSPIPPPTPPGKKKLLTIGMATCDDYDGVYFSAQSIRIFHPEITEDTEILVVDNHPDGPCAQPLKKLENYISGYRYVPFDRWWGTAVRDIIFREANSDFVLVMDSHVLFAPGSLSRLLSFLKTQTEAVDLWQGPLVGDDLKTISTHFDPDWSEGMYGKWGTDQRGVDVDAPPFEIDMQGLGIFACRKSAWPGFNPRLRGFGGEEGFIHEKFRQRGGKTLCLPFLRWVHRFDRPLGPHTWSSWNDRIRNYLIEYDELGLDPAPAIAHFETLDGFKKEMTEAAQKEIAGPFHYFDAIYCISLDRAKTRWEAVLPRFQNLGIARRVQRFPAIETPHSHHIGCALSHRAILAEAKRYGFRSILVFEDDVVFTADALEALERSMAELQVRPWQLFYLGGHAWGKSFPKAEGCHFLERPEILTCTHAIAYHESIYDRILADVPESPTSLALWLRTEKGIDQYYAFTLACEKFVASPVVASQPSILGAESRIFQV